MPPAPKCVMICKSGPVLYSPRSVYSFMVAPVVPMMGTVMQKMSTP